MTLAAKFKMNYLQFNFHSNFEVTVEILDTYSVGTYRTAVVRHYFMSHSIKALAWF